jgi:hypothetical protein
LTLWSRFRGLGGEALLDSYEQERRPVAARSTRWALFTFMNDFVTDAGFGLVPGGRGEAIDPMPVVKLHTLDAGFVWLLVDLNADGDKAYLCACAMRAPAFRSWAM